MVGLNVRLCSRCVQQLPTTTPTALPTGLPTLAPSQVHTRTMSSLLSTSLPAHADNLHLFVISAAHPASHDGSDGTADRPADDQPQSGSKPDAFAGAHRCAFSNAHGDKAEDDALVLGDCRICLILQGLAISVEV